jgi:hypothetical protein
METLFAIGMMVGLMKSRAEPRQIQPDVPAQKPWPHGKSEWPLGY